MSDRKPIGDLFDLPTGRGNRESTDRGGSSGSSADGPPQGDLFDGAEPFTGDEVPETQPSEVETPEIPQEPLWHDAPNEARRVEEHEHSGHHPIATSESDDPIAVTDQLYEAVGATPSGGFPAPEPEGPGGGSAKAVGVVTRWLGGVADVIVHLTVLAIGLFAMVRLGLEPSLHLWPGFAAFLTSFSFVYVTLPLAFWGQTPGMATRSLRAIDQGGMSLTLVQAIVRWAAALATVGLLGLPLLVAVRGRSLADLLSGTETESLR